MPGIQNSQIRLRCIVAAVLGLFLPLAGPYASAAPEPLLALVDAAVQAGSLDASEAAVLRLELILAPETVDATHRPTELLPLRCATAEVLDATRRLPEMNASQRQRVTQLLERPSAKASFTHPSPSGNFLLHYETTGNDRVPLEDIDPANGIPDYVERIASYLDNAWAVEFDAMGYVPPPLTPAPYDVYFQFMFSYGFTQLAGDRTEIVLHYNFEVFDPNDDPEGNAAGSAKVTCAHELKHASQHETTGWVEGNWLELDATWIEDMVYPQVNDYHHFLVQQGALADPSSPFDYGGTGSYGDCIWQHYLAQRFGPQLIASVWARRAMFPAETMLESYDTVLLLNGSSLQGTWRRYALWNYLTGTRSTPGLSYQEADGYPNAPLTAFATTYPFAHVSSIDRMAANYIECTGLPAAAGTLDFVFQRDPGSDLRLFSIARLRDGSTTITEHPNANNIAISLSTALEDLNSVGFVVANGEYSSGPVGYSLDVTPTIIDPIPALGLDATSITSHLAAGSIAQAQVELRNDGSTTSWLDFEVHLLESLPPASLLKSVAGSTIVPDTTMYTPGDTLVIGITLSNNSPDGEWISAASVVAPPGAHILSSSDLSASSGTLISDQSVGDGATVHWFDPNGGYGEIRNAQTATATMTVAFNASLLGVMEFNWNMDGDQWDANPHSVSGSFALSGPNINQLRLDQPVDGSYLRIGDSVALVWSSSGPTLPPVVDLDLSRDGGQNWTPLATDTPNDGSFDWVVDAPASNDVRLRIRNSDSSLLAEGGLAAVIYEGADWLASSPSTGSLVGGATQALMLRVDGAGLLPGIYPAWVAIIDPRQGLAEVLPFTANVLSGTPTSPALPRTRLLQPVPNPFNPSTQISFETAREGHVHLRIVDSRGALVATLVDELLPSGEHAVIWRGKDNGGQPVASGVYRALLEADESMSVRPLTLVR